MPRNEEITAFSEWGFVRKECSKCSSPYWTADEARTTCGDSPCDEYSFIDTPPITTPMDIDAMRQYYLDFFAQRDHEVVDRYPVVARWRNDIYLTIASIADFQPHATSGDADPPANPLVISQPCIRLNDLDLVGRTGRHLSEFEMMAHHAFNRDEAEIYWKDRTVRHCQELMLGLGIDAGKITYKENPWVGGGNGGDALEVIVGGLELSTLVFMDHVEDPAGSREIKGAMYSPMPKFIVDTGYGLERFVWASSGEPTVYDSNLGALIKILREEAGLSFGNDEHRIMSGYSILSALEAYDTEDVLLTELAGRTGLPETDLRKTASENAGIYVMADHARTLAYMLGDGIVPSNAKAGYLARLVLRRAERVRRRVCPKLTLAQIVGSAIELHIPYYTDQKDRIGALLDLESDRYHETLDKGTSLVEKRLKKGSIDVEGLIELYDTHGIHPEVVSDIAVERQMEVDVPRDFDAILADMHSKSEPAEAGGSDENLVSMIPDFQGLEPTKQLYYEERASDFSAKIVAVSEPFVVLDGTHFYPEGGGQPSDLGMISFKGTEHPVTEVMSQEGLILHRLEPFPDGISVGDDVTGSIDWERRMAHARHHTGTHLVIGAAQRVLGEHVWQAGSGLDDGSARIDITHFKNLTLDEVHEIERVANKAILDMIPVTVEWLNRNDAEKMYGFRLYQGGAPKANIIRVVRTGPEDDVFDVEACGGTHCINTGEIGLIKITGWERIQDGVERIIFSAGAPALAEVQHMEDLLKESAGVVSVPAEHLPKTVARFFEEWKSFKKEVEALTAENAELKLTSLASDGEQISDVNVVVTEASSMVEASQMARGLLKTESSVGLFIAKDGKAAASSNVDAVNATELLRAAVKHLGGGGGGSATYAQGGGPQVMRIKEAREAGLQFIKDRL